MNVKEPASAQALGGNGGRPTPWAQARERLAGVRSYWTVTNHPSGRSHVRPVFAVWVDGALHFTSDLNARKSRNLEAAAQCSIATSDGELDLVIEGTAVRVTDHERLKSVAAEYKAKYGWPVTVVDGAFTAPYAAPTAGDGPFAIYVVEPVTVFGFPAIGNFTPTRWNF